MKKLPLLGMTMLLGAGLAFAQDTGGTAKGASKAGKTGKAGKVSHAHKGGKGGKGDAKVVEENSFSYGTSRTGVQPANGTSAGKSGKTSLGELTDSVQKGGSKGAGSGGTTPTAKARPKPGPHRQRPPDKDNKD
jgi:hypothetical protein